MMTHSNDDEFLLLLLNFQKQFEKLTQARVAPSKKSIIDSLMLDYIDHEIKTREIKQQHQVEYQAMLLPSHTRYYRNQN